MNQLILQESLGSTYVQERRKNERYTEVHLLVITSRGTGKIMDIGKDGLSFGCLYPHAFPATWSMDIIDARGTHIKQLKVRKVWERNSASHNLSDSFEIEIGVEFFDLTLRQENELDLLLINLNFMDVKSPLLLY